jgi:hypothetical protein
MSWGSEEKFFVLLCVDAIVSFSLISEFWLAFIIIP